MRLLIIVDELEFERGALYFRSMHIARVCARVRVKTVHATDA